MREFSRLYKYTTIIPQLLSLATLSSQWDRSFEVGNVQTCGTKSHVSR